MEQEMKVDKHKMVEKHGEDPQYQVHLKTEVTLKNQVMPGLIILSNDEHIFEEYPLGQFVNVKVSKPQQQLK